MKVKELFEEVLEEELSGKEKDFYNRGYRFFIGIRDPEGTFKKFFKDRKSAEEYLGEIKKNKKTDATQVTEIYELKETLSEMAMEEKQRRLKALHDHLVSITDELRNIDPKDIARKQSIINKRFEIQKQINTIKSFETTK